MAVSIDEADVLSRNRAFYAAFRQRDLQSMDELWAKAVPVACIHPGWQAIRGRAQVMESWRAILAQASSPDIHCKDATASVIGETALVLCEESLDDGRLVATNIFVREEGEWRICHHQAGPLASAQSEREADEQEDTDDSDEHDALLLRPSRSSRRLLN